MIDDHCHPFRLNGGPIDLSAFNLDTRADEESVARRRALGPMRTIHQLLQRRLCIRLNCEEQDLPSARAEASSDWPAYVSGLFAEAQIDQLIMDTDYPPGAEQHLDEYRALSGCSVHRIMRIDNIVDSMMADGASAREMVARVQRKMEEGVGTGVVGFKTILTYRTGLAVEATVTLEEAEKSLASNDPIPSRGKACRDWILRQCLGTAADLDRPMQIHTGFGDSDLRLVNSNPLLLEDLLRTSEGSSGKILLMVGYPWHEELAYMAATKPNVWADVSMFNLYAPVTFGDRLLRILDLVSARRLLLGTDGYGEPEMYWFGASILTQSWLEVRRTLSGAGCSDSWLDEVSRMIFGDNAREFYAV